MRKHNNIHAERYIDIDLEEHNEQLDTCVTRLSVIKYLYLAAAILILLIGIVGVRALLVTGVSMFITYFIVASVINSLISMCNNMSFQNDVLLYLSKDTATIKKHNMDILTNTQIIRNTINAHVQNTTPKDTNTPT